MRMISNIKKLIRCKSGNALVVVAACAPLLIGSAAIGVDTIQVALAKRRLQRAADSSAMAGAFAIVQSNPVGTAVSRDLVHNNPITLTGTPTVENAPTTGPMAGNARAVRVVLTATRAVPFMSFFTGSSMTVRVEATAAAVPDGIYCVVSLENTSATGVTFGGNANTNLGCGVATNSTGAQAIRVNGNPNVVATPIAAVGNVPPASEFNGTTTTLPYSVPQSDPYAHLQDPVVPSDCQGPWSQGPNDLPPPITGTNGVYCFQGMDFKGEVTLPPGVYIIDGGSLSFGSQANVTGNGVTFVLSSSSAALTPSSIADISMNGGAQLNLTAPTSGPFAGILLYQDRRAPQGSSHINGGSNSVIDGAWYMPNHELIFNGGSDVDVRCLRIVARQVTFSGNNTIQNTCDANDPDRGYTGLTVRLVG